MGKILIVDDSNLIRSVTAKATEEAGHEPILAINGEDGLEILRSEEIDLIFSDVNMPVMDGIEMVKQIKQDDSLKFIPIVMFTTESDPDLKAKGRELGVKAWMVKPFSKEKFILAIKKLIG